MHYCCAKYCQNKSPNALYFDSQKLIAGSLLSSRIYQENEEMPGSVPIKFKNTNVSIDSIDNCRICESQFKSGKWLNAVLVFYKALHFILSRQKWKYLGESAHCLNTTSDDSIPNINVSPDDVEDSPVATHNHHKVTIRSRFLKKRKLFHDVVCILRYCFIFIHLST